MTTIRIEIGEEEALPSTANRSREGALARANNPLPWRVDVLNEAAMAQINQLLGEIASNPSDFTPVDIAGAWWLQAMLVTGRRLGRLVELGIYREKPANLQDRRSGSSPTGLYQDGSNWAWWLSAGRGTSRQAIAPYAPKVHRRSEHHVLLWCGPRSIRLFEAALAHGAFGLQSVPDGHQVATTLAAATTAVQTCLKQLTPAERLWATIDRIERWHWQQLVTHTGDVVTASIITGRVDQLSNAGAHYTWMSRKQVFERHHALVRPLEQLSSGSASQTLANGLPNVSPRQSSTSLGHGSRYVPTLDSVKELAAKLKETIAATRPSSPTPAPSELIEFHRTFTLYSLALLGFSAALRRSRSPFPEPQQIDEETGFAVLNDKDKNNADRIRLIWLPDVARAQIGHFGRHMEAVGRIGDSHRGVVLPQPPILQPAYLAKSGNLGRLSVAELEDRFARLKFPFQLNGWRHFLRTELIDRVPADVVDAFMGHAQRGREPWARHAGLDPLAYRAALEHALVPLLQECGWDPVPGLE
jgi:hypothetical protein